MSILALPNFETLDLFGVRIQFSQMVSYTQQLSSTIARDGEDGDGSYLLEVGFVFVVGLLIGLGFLVYHNLRIARLNTNLTRQQLELAQANKALQLQQERLQELDQFKNKIFSIVVHDFKTPLNQVEGLLALLGQRNITAESSSELAEKLKEKVQHTNATISNLIMWANSQMRGGVKVRSCTFDLNSFLQRIVDYHSFALVNKNVHLRTQRYSAIDTLTTDESALFLILNNLISNAIKYSLDGDTIELTMEVNDDMYVFSVVDHGVGMNAEMLTQLTHVSSTSTPGTNNERGTGLGLIVTKSIVQLLNGELEFESRENYGTTVAVKVPKMKESTEFLKERAELLYALN